MRPIVAKAVGRPMPSRSAEDDSAFVAHRPGIEEPAKFDDTPVRYGNFAENPWALPLTREMHQQHEESVGYLRSHNVAESDAKRSELVRAAMPGTLSLRRSGAGEVLHSRNSSEVGQGAWSSPDHMSQPEAVSKLALAWPGRNAQGGDATRADQHQHETEWASVPGAERLESVASPQVHPDGSILPGGGRQVWHPGARWMQQGAGTNTGEVRTGGLGAEEVRKGTVAGRARFFDGVGSRT